MSSKAQNRSSSTVTATEAQKRFKMQSVPDARQQTFEEIYGPPENFLEIEVPTRQITRLLPYQDQEEG